MTPKTFSSWKSMRNIDGLEYLDVQNHDDYSALTAVAGQASEPIDWDEVVLTIHSVLGRMVPPLRSKYPDLQSRAGRTSGTNFALFAYRDFERSNTDIEPLVVGINIESEPSGEAFRVLGDLCTEESGQILAEVPARTVKAEQAQLLAAVYQATQELILKVDVIDQWLTGDPESMIRLYKN